MTTQVTPGDLHTYEIKLGGALDEDWVAAYCPAGVKVEYTGEVTLLSNIVADQASLVGLIRNLHGLGCSLLSVICCP